MPGRSGAGGTVSRTGSRRMRHLPMPLASATFSASPTITCHVMGSRMRSTFLSWRPCARSGAPIFSVLAAIGALSAVACTHSGASGAGTGPAPANDMSMTAPNPDPRVGLKAGWYDAGEAIWNLRHVSTTPPSANFTNPKVPGDSHLKNSDLAFLGTTSFRATTAACRSGICRTPRS